MHWARDADEANEIITDIIKKRAAREVIKVKTMTSNEMKLNEHLEENGITPYETDLADLIVQLGDDHPSHIVVPALHINRVQIREIFEKRMPLKELGMEGLTDAPEQLAEAARRYLRHKFLTVNVGISGANFAVAETGVARRCRERRQWPHVPDASGSSDLYCGNRKAHSHVPGS